MPTSRDLRVRLSSAHGRRLRTLARARRVTAAALARELLAAALDREGSPSAPPGDLAFFDADGRVVRRSAGPGVAFDLGGGTAPSRGVLETLDAHDPNWRGRLEEAGAYSLPALIVEIVAAALTELETNARSPARATNARPSRGTRRSSVVKVRSRS